MTTKVNVPRLALVLIVCSCGGDDETSPDGGTGDDGGDAGGDFDAGTQELAGPCPLETRIGEFEIAHRQAFSAVTGSVREAVIPNAVLVPLLEEGDCRLLRRVNPVCDPPCGVGQSCTNDKKCVPFPVNHSVGTVTVAGLTTNVTMEPNDVNFSYQSTDVDSPPFEPAAAIQLTAEGADLKGFDLFGFGVEPIVTSDPEWVMVPGEALEITWDVATGPWEIHVTLNVDQHGASPVTLFCDLDDTGTGTIAASLVDELIAQGVSGFAAANLFRRTVDSVEIAEGCVQLATLSHLVPMLMVDQ